MEYREIPNIILEDRPGRELLFRNFAGEESKFNPAGRRSFNLILEPDLAKRLIDDGWNVREKETRDGDLQYRLQVFVNYTNPRRVPRIKMIRSTDGRGVSLNEQTVGQLDAAEIEKFDICITPYQWELASRTSGIKAFVKSMNCVIEHDDIADKYTNYAAEEEELPFL